MIFLFTFYKGLRIKYKLGYKPFKIRVLVIKLKINIKK